MFDLGYIEELEKVIGKRLPEINANNLHLRAGYVTGENNWITGLSLYKLKPGHIPFEIIAKMEDLTSLNLSGNNLTEIPGEIAQLNYLTDLDLSNNRIKLLRTEIFSMSKLAHLNLCANYIKTLPPEIKELKSLKLLDISHNCLTSLPGELGKLQQLESLYALWNQLTTIPKEIAELKNLHRLYLNDNEIKSLPPEILKWITSRLITVNIGPDFHDTGISLHGNHLEDSLVRAINESYHEGREPIIKYTCDVGNEEYCFDPVM